MERRQPPLEEMTNAPAPGSGFLTNPHHLDRQDDKCPTNARGAMGTPGID